MKKKTKWLNDLYQGDYSDYINAPKMTLEMLEEALKNGELDLKKRQNEAPTVGEFLEFLRDHPTVHAHGYIITDKREDERVSIEGLEYEGIVGKSLQGDFYELCSHADELEVNGYYLRSWWD